MSELATFFGSISGGAQPHYLPVVAAGGLLGGLLQPVVAKLDERAKDPPVAAFWQTPLLGMAAAGISVYVLADSQLDEPIRLLFFALLCGLAFPSVLLSAIDKVGQRTRDVQLRAAEIAGDAGSDGIEQTVRAAQKLRSLLVQNPPGSISPSGQQVIESVAQQAVTSIAQTPAASEALQRQVVDELKELGTVAKSAGWDKTAQATASALERLSETIDDRVIKASAERGAARLTEPEA